MINVSDKFLEIVSKNYRPKCEPKIELTTLNNNEEEIKKTWLASNIKNLSYKRGVDPIGRTLPYMELTWTETYKGKFDENGNIPLFYEDLKYSAIDLSFTQNLGFRNTWGDLKNKTWGDLAAFTWGQLKNQIQNETVTMPRMFLESNPTIEGQTITWKAYDLLYFLNYTEVKDFKQREYFDTGTGQYVRYTIPFVNPIKYLLINARAEFIDSPLIIDAIQQSLYNLTTFQDEHQNLFFEGWIIFEDSFKNNLMHYAAVENLHIDFNADGSFKLVEFAPTTELKQSFNKKLIYKYPQITRCNDISNFVYKLYNVVEQFGNDYEAPQPRVLSFGEKTIYVYDFDGYGSVSDFYSGKVYSEINRAAGINKSELGNTDGYVLRCGKLSLNPEELSLNNNKSGDIYTEDNPLFYFKVNQAEKRLYFLDEYFNKKSSSLQFETPGNVALEPKDLIEVETNLFNGNNQITKTAIIISFEINYAGSIKQKIIAHEVKV